MKKATKILAGTAIGSAAALGAFCTVTYECMLNIDVSRIIGEKFGPKPEPAPAPCAEEAEPAPAPNLFGEAMAKWHSEHTAEDIFLINEKGQKRHAKLFDNGHPEKWAIIFHGYTSGPEGMYHYAYAYGAMGFNLILPSMIGHAQDENRYCSMGYHDRYMGLDWINYVVSSYPNAEIVLHGESMGAVTTMLITGEKLPENVKCAVEDCGFTTCMEEYNHVAKTQISPQLAPLLPVISIYSQLRGNFNFKKCAPIDAVKNSVTPTLFIHGEADDFVPFPMMARVFDACAAEKEFFTVPGAGHAESSTRDPKFYWTNVYSFVKKHVTSW